MREEKIAYKHKKMKLMNKTTFFVSLLIVATLVFSSAIPAINLPSQTTKTNEKIQRKITDTTSTGLAPVNGNSAISVSKNALGVDSQSNSKKMMLSEPFPIMYGYVAYSSGMSNGPCYFSVEDPATVEKLSDETIPNFASGGVYTCDLRWLVCGYGTGALYEIDIETGEISEIGGGGVNLNGLAYNHLSNLCYGAGDYGLYLIDQDTGAQEYIGDFGGGSMYMIGMSFRGDGVLYGWDLNDYLWTIDTDTGAATQVGPLGFNLNYQQDGAFCLEDDILYLAAFIISPIYGSYLLECDVDTGQCTVIGQFEGNAQANMLVIPYNCSGVYPIARFTWTPAHPDPNETIFFNASASYDSDGFITLYEWDWNNDGIFDENHTSPTATHIYEEIGNYPVTLRVTDNDSLTDNKTGTVRIENQPPDPPTIDGPIHGKVGVEYNWFFVSIDPDEDDVYYLVKWGDGCGSQVWVGPYPSGEEITIIHAYNREGTFVIYAKAVDIYDTESDWATFEVIFSKSKAINYNNLFLKLVAKFPFLHKFIDILERYE